MDIYIHPITKEEFVDFNGVVSDRENPLRQFEFVRLGEKRQGLAVSLKVPSEIGTKHKLIPVDVVCFEVSEFPKILKMKLKSGVKVKVTARITERGPVINEASDIEIAKSL